MALSIHTNFAATVAANNLSTSTSVQQRSLNRLSSGSKIVTPSDDAGGLAVSMKLSAAARRMGSLGANLANSISFLQTQDGALKVTGKILERIGELKTLNEDPTKNASDKANYNSEFQALQAELNSIANEKFNGNALFGSTAMSVATSEDHTQSVDLNGINLMGTSEAGTPNPSPDFNSLDAWNASGPVSASGGTLSFTGDGSVTTKDTFTGPFSITLKLTGVMRLTASGTQFLAGSFSGNTVKYEVDGSGNGTVYEDGVPIFPVSGHPNNVQIGIEGMAGATAQFISISGTPSPVGAGSGNVNSAATASDLSSLSLDTITGAIQDVATYRAQNGANQSRIGVSMDLLTANKANLESANSRITDVDVADESTVLAKSNVLVQAGTAMLSQASQANQNIMRLIG